LTSDFGMKTYPKEAWPTRFSTSLLRIAPRKQCEIRPYLPWNANRKSQALYQTVLFPMAFTIQWHLKVISVISQVIVQASRDVSATAVLLVLNFFDSAYLNGVPGLNGL